MGYIVVKDFNKHGCTCFCTKDFNLVCSTLDFLNKVLDVKRIQVVFLSDPTMYGEYEPYRFIDDLGDFVKEALSI